MATPQILTRLSAIVNRLLPSESFDEYDRWKGEWHMRRYIADGQLGIRRPRSLRVEALKHAQDLLAPLADSPLCRAKKRKWTGDCVTLDTPYGCYIWHFTVRMVLDLKSLPPEFVAGFRHSWTGDEGIERDDNPCIFGDREASWDKGYILGLAWCYHKTRIVNWCMAREVEASAVA